MKEEKQIEQFISEIMKTEGLENPPSHNFTQQALNNAAIYLQTKKRKKRDYSLIMMLLLGLLLIGSLSIALYFLWQSGQLAWLGNNISQLIHPVLQMLPFKIPLGIIGAIALHFVLVRVAIAIVLFKKRYRLLNIQIIRN